MGFLKGGAIGATFGGVSLLLLALALGSRILPAELAILTCLVGGSMGAGIGGVIGAVRRANRPPLLVVRRRRRGFVPAPAVIDLRPRLAISALYALTAASAGTLLAVSLFGRSEVTRLVGSLVPYEVSSLQARLMLSGTLFLCAYTLIAGLSLRAGQPGAREQRAIAAAGFLTGIFGLPSLAVVLT